MADEIARALHQERFGNPIIKWEYLVRNMPEDEQPSYNVSLTNFLDVKGREGWELIHRDPQEGTLIFKRPRR